MSDTAWHEYDPEVGYPYWDMLPVEPGLQVRIREVREANSVSFICNRGSLLRWFTSLDKARHWCREGYKTDPHVAEIEAINKYNRNNKYGAMIRDSPFDQTVITDVYKAFMDIEPL